MNFCPNVTILYMWARDLWLTFVRRNECCFALPVGRKSIYLQRKYLPLPMARNFNNEYGNDECNSYYSRMVEG